MYQLQIMIRAERIQWDRSDFDGAMPFGGNINLVVLFPNVKIFGPRF